MKKASNFCLVALAALTLYSCSSVPPNHEGVLMENYGRNGKEDFSVVTGRVSTIAWGTQLFTVPMFEQRGDCEPLKVYTRDASEFTVDPLYVYEPKRGNAIEIIFNYKHLGADADGFFENIEGSILNSRVLNAYRETARLYTTDSLMGHVNEFEQLVEDRLVKEFDIAFFTLKELTSNLTPPRSMMATIEARNNAVQQAIQVENEIKVAEARAKIKIIEAETDARTNELRTRTLTPLLIQQEFIQKWDGRTPLYGGAPTLFKNVEK